MSVGAERAAKVVIDAVKPVLSGADRPTHLLSVYAEGEEGADEEVDGSPARAFVRTRRAAP